MTINTLEFAADDLHVHLRDNNDGRLQMAAPLTARQFGRALVMPNLVPPVRTVTEAIAYRERILRFTDGEFEPLMTLYLTETSSVEDIMDIVQNPGIVHAIKYYPAGATTNSDAGVRNIRSMMKFFQHMETNDIVLSLHGETADPNIDVFDREKRFIDDDWWHIRHHFPDLRMVLEHITTEEAVKAVQAMQLLPEHRIVTSATITPQHLLANRNEMLGNGINPHLYCKPILKREEDRIALLEVAVSGKPCFFLGTDSAPHAKHLKENACGCAGCFTGLHALELYAEAFDSVGMIDMLPDFAGRFGADFYDLPLPTRQVKLVREEWVVPTAIDYHGAHYHQETGAFSVIVPFYAGETLHWKMAD